MWHFGITDTVVRTDNRSLWQTNNKRCHRLQFAAMPEQDPWPDGTEAAGTADAYTVQERQSMQHTLFSTEEVLLPEALRTMRKAVAAIHAVPSKPDTQHTLNSRRLFDACVLVAQVDIRRREKTFLDRVRSERISPMFEVRTSELSKLAGIKGTNLERTHEELQRLYEMSLQWNVVGEDANTLWNMQSHFLSAIGIGNGLKRGMVKFSLDPEVLLLVLEPSNWATLSLQAMEGLGTEASYSLYQNAFRYLGTASKLTAALPTETWVELLLGKCGYLEYGPKGEKRVVRYGDFKRRHLLDAIERVNSVPALGYMLSLKEIKSGNRVARLQFKFEPKKVSQGLLPLTWPKDVITALEHLGFTPEEVQDISQSRSFEEVAESLVKLKTAEDKLRAAGRRISSKKAYFQGILVNVAAGANLDVLEHEKIEAEVRAQEEKQAAHNREVRLREAFDRDRAQVFTEQLFAWGEDKRTALLAKFEEEDKRRGGVAKGFLRKGLIPANGPLIALLRDWLAKNDPSGLDELLPFPHQRSYEAWLAWRLDMAGGGNT